VNWLVNETTKVKLPLVSGGEVPKSIAVRFNDYEEKLREARDIETSAMSIFGRGLSDKLKKVRQEAAVLKKSLQDDLDNQTAKMKSALREVLTYNQRRMPTVPEPAETAPVWSRLTWIDGIVKYGLTAVGVGLLIGLFTRLSCFGGVLLLLMFYLAMPPWPGLGDSMARGHYLFINENIIESLALLAIAFSHPAGRYGLDTWISSFRRGGRRRQRMSNSERERRSQQRPLLAR